MASHLVYERRKFASLAAFSEGLASFFKREVFNK